MKILEFGDQSKRKIILIHGFQSPWQVWEPYIDHYKRDFHLIVPVLPGHDPGAQEGFISFEDAACRIETWCEENIGTDIYAVFGMSMGGVMASTLWQRAKLKIGKLIMDGSPLVSYHPLMKKMMTAFYLNVTHKTQQRDSKTLKRAKQIAAERFFEDFVAVLDHMSDETIQNSINGIAAYHFPAQAAQSGTAIHYFHGTAVNEMLARKTAKFIRSRYPEAKIVCFKGKGHCEYSIHQPDVMMGNLDKILL